MNPNIPWPSMFKANPSISRSQWGEASNPSAISGQRQSCEGISSENEETSQQESKPRWNPKPEQIRVLQSIFNSGVTNPTPEEIKRIRAQLQEFGEIRDASVFYWFRNKKARTKQRQRHLHSGETSKSGSENGTGEESMYGRSITIVINNVPGQVPVGPINVKAMFGENAVLLHSTGQPILQNEWGFTMECLQDGAMYYLV
uniref:WUSCHEL homeobox protein n=1 Tax=Pinus pinaster TaxID=71647 RepID=A0A2I4KAN8_PINPS|nr:WUSCHEL homeobox protein [Pinus pinaster]